MLFDRFRVFDSRKQFLQVYHLEWVMRALWEITEQMVVLFGVSLIGIQVSFMIEFYLLAAIFAATLLLSSAVLMLQFYNKKQR